MISLLLLLLLGACSAQQALAPTPPPAPTLPTVAELLAGGPSGPVRAVGYLLITTEGAALVDGLRLIGPDAPAPLEAGGIWLGQGASLAPDAPMTEAGDTRYAIVEAAGELEGPGQYGPGGSYSFAMADPQLEVRTARDLSIPLLLGNSALYEGQPVRLRGQLLASPGTALLVESLGAGGVPDAAALQVKLAAAPADPQLLAALRQSEDGRVVYGPVEVVGVWRTGRLYPLAVVPA